MNQFCKQCILPINYLNIDIDANGVCQHCRTYQPIDFLGKEKLVEFIQEPLKRNKSLKYDCIVGFSGGRDSSYLLWYIVHELKLRPLAVFSDDLFIPEVILQNIKKTCEILHVDLRIIQHDNLKKCLPHHLNAWIKRPVPETLTFINVGERIGYETLVELEAVKEGVKLIFAGRTPIQATAQYKASFMKLGYKGGTLSWMLGYLKQVLLNPFLVMNLFSIKTQYREFRIKSWKKRLVKKHQLTIIQPFYKHLPWIEKEIDTILFNELKWESPKADGQTARIGCEVDTLRQYFYYKTVGYNDMNVDLSGLIRNGQISRKEAIKRLKTGQNISEEEIKYILTKAGVNANQFMEKLNKKYPVN